VGDYATYPSFEPDYALAGAGLGGLVTGVGSYALRKASTFREKLRRKIETLKNQVLTLFLL
jgi:hypothetical protein